MLVSGALLGLLIGLAVGRDWRRLALIDIRWLPLLIAVLAMRPLALVAGPAAFPLYVSSLAGTALVAAVNWRLPGVSLIAIGSVLNLVVVVTNGGMPVDSGALALAGANAPTDVLHTALTAQTMLAALADVVPVPLVRGVYSVGDLAIAVGGFLLPFLTLARR